MYDKIEINEECETQEGSRVVSNAEQNNRDNVECKTHGILSYEQAEKITIDG